MSKHIKYEFDLHPNSLKKNDLDFDYASVIELNKLPYSIVGIRNKETGIISMVIEKITFDNLSGSEQITQQLKAYITSKSCELQTN